MTDYSHTNPLVAPRAVARWLDRLPLPVAVTGGTGFVGSHLVDTLCAAGIEPRVLVRDRRAPRWIADAPVEWIEGALDDGEALERLVAGAGTVFHLAGVVRAGREADFDIGNRRGTASLVSAVRTAAPGARLVHVSSLAAAGPSKDSSGIGPEVEPSPISWYGRSKLAAENEVRALGEATWWSIVRPPAIYGPRDTDIFEFFRMASRGIVAVPSGERWLTVAWAGDVVRSIISTAVGEAGGVFHLGQADPILLDSLIGDLCRAGGVSSRVIRVPAFAVGAAGAVGGALQRCGWRRLPLTSDKARELLARHWTSRTAESMRALGIERGMNFREGAVLCWSWYRARGWVG
jgi:nucleoside-diphosphate-sugar epimerase